MRKIVGWETERKVNAILKVLSESAKPLGSIAIARKLEGNGFFLSERAIRFYLKKTDDYGYTRSLGHNGRIITPLGLEEIKMALAPEQVGLRVDQVARLAFETTFDPEKLKGNLPISVALINKDKFKKALTAMKDSFKSGICVSELVGVASESERLGFVVVPNGKIGLATISSIVVDGVLLKAGVSTNHIFAGIFQLRNFKPTRFVAIINYSGTSLEPTELFMRAGMTSVREAAKDGSGMVMASFCEMPAAAKPIADRKLAMLRRAGIVGVYAVGNIGEPVCQTPVGSNRIGMIQLVGSNPVAAVAEAGIDIEIMPGCGVIDFQRLTSFWQLYDSTL